MTDTARNRRVLVLEYATCYDDLSQALACQFSFFVDVVRMLSGQGNHDVRVKLHPGGDRLGYYRKIASEMELNCAISQDGHFGDHVAWADAVIGPAHSGAMLEVLARGKPYLPVLLPPHAANEEYMRNGQVFSDVENLRQALEDPGLSAEDGLLSDFASFDTIPDPAVRIWSALTELASKAAN